MQEYVVERGSVCRAIFVLRAAGASSTAPPQDPNEFPAAPRFSLHSASGGTKRYGGIPFKLRLDRGVFEVHLPITTDASGFQDSSEGGEGLHPSGLPDGDYELRLEYGSVGGVAMVDAEGDVPTVLVRVRPSAMDVPEDRFYATGADLGRLFGLDPAPTDDEIRYAQLQLDSYMHRSIWPTIYTRERHEIPPDRNLVKLDCWPVIRLMDANAASPISAAGVLGRFGHGRRDRRTMNQVNHDYVSAMMVLGSPPQFTPIVVSQIEMRAETGELWLPSGFFLINYSQVEVTYEAGFPTVPQAVKAALAEMIAWIRFKGYSNLTSYSEGRVSRQTGETFVTESIARLIERYRLKTYRGI